MDFVDRLAYRIFGGYIHGREEKFESLREDIRKARLPVAWDVYAAKAYLYAILTAVVAVVGLGLATYLAMTTLDVPSVIKLRGPLAQYQDFIVQNRALLAAGFASLVIGPIIGFTAYFLYMMLPQLSAYDRARNIEINLPSAVTFLYAITSGGANVIEGFEELSESENAYGEVSTEASLIIRDMELFGDDLNSALRRRVNNSPSREFAEFCSSLISILDSGGDLTTFFHEKAEEYERQAIQALEGYLETLGLLAETYTTAFVAGPIFIIIMTSVMTLMQSGGGGMATMALFVTIYAVLPIGAAMFVVMIDMLSPEEAAGGFEPFEVETDSRPVSPMTEEQEEKLQKIKRDEKIYRWKQKLKRPHEPFLYNPYYSLIIGIPIGLAIIAAGFLGAPLNEGLDPVILYIDDYVIFGVLAAIVPLAAFHEVKKRRTEALRAKIPDLLSELASMNEMGLTLVESFEYVSGGQGKLDKEMTKVKRELSWGESISESLKKFANRVRSAEILKAMTLITRALRASGQISEVLRIAADDALRRRDLERERGTQIFVYVVIIYLSFLVFIAIVGILAIKFLPVMQQNVSGGASAGAAAGGGGRQFGGAIDVALFKRSFFHAAIVQGFSSGIVAGKMGEGSVLSGLKHSIVMVLIAYVAFFFLI